MSQDRMQRASIPNPALQPFSIFIGDWETTGTHPLVPGTTLHGRSTFEWLENGAFLLRRTEIDDERFPSGLAIFGSDDTIGQYFMLYFDERGVSRKFEVTLHDNVMKTQRLVPGFSQRSTETMMDGGNTILVESELSRDDATWQKDLVLTYKRVK